ncbi:hypothetical protein [Tropicibacter naphthalenivorans]|uniref:Transcriptional regulator containing PAS, AAA-type ATPase, and DNA-binding domains n=1 Tax=Tropicibacter naphthalenivorans TaxID=441103 RepID=A0A0P1H0Q3_9RHOB|nr:hypothetical protein [Tropicibacter naphthalenivorans]CUH81335.1 Transcriptional regulator containing PAS, AAA-type ATPase, and DNA-binding domains [Tropicibacter naphthalenivorans]SMC98434.1 hypothetical protein SAMN04488093_108131 [Tropicibacter naphthalenivorans]
MLDDIKDSKFAGIKGILLTDDRGKVQAAMGQGEDRRVRTMAGNRAWLQEAAERRITPLLLNDAQFAALVTQVQGGYLVVLSEPPSDTVLDFILKVDFAYDILNHILSDPYDAMAVVDDQERLAYISPVHEKFFGVQSGDGVGRKIRDVIENTRLHHVVRTGVAEVGQIHRMRGKDRVVSRHPILHDGKIVGAAGDGQRRRPAREPRGIRAFRL